MKSYKGIKTEKYKFIPIKEYSIEGQLIQIEVDTVFIKILFEYVNKRSTYMR